LNRQSKLYVVYDFKESEDEIGHHEGHDFEEAAFDTGQDWLSVQNLPSASNQNSKVFLGRNQYTKEHMYLTIRIAGEGTTTYCYKSNGSKQKIMFTSDHDNAI
jgi:hypothetical protein